MKNNMWMILGPAAFAVLVIFLLVEFPTETHTNRICRDCLSKERSVKRYMLSTKSVEGNEFADWFKANHPGHAHAWTTRHEFEFSLLRPAALLHLATSAPTDFHDYRRLIESNDPTKELEALALAINRTKGRE